MKLQDETLAKTKYTDTVSTGYFMKMNLNYMSVSISGDYYQISFHEKKDNGCAEITDDFAVIGTASDASRYMNPLNKQLKVGI